MTRVASILLLTAVFCLGAAAAACGGADITPPTEDIDLARDQVAKAEIMVVKTAVSAYVASTGSLPAAATHEVLGTYAEPWPKNPWTEAPMVPGERKGDIVYTPGAGTAFTVGVHLSDGSTFTAP